MRVLNKRGQVVLSASFLTILIMLTIAFVAYTTAIFNVNQYFDDYVVIGINYRAAGEAVSRDALANFTSYCYFKGYSTPSDPTCIGLPDADYNMWKRLINETFPNSFASSSKGKVLAFEIVPLTSWSFSTPLSHGFNVSWPGYFPQTIRQRPYLAFSVSSFEFNLDAPSEGFSGLKFRSTTFLAINVTKVMVQSEKLSVTFYSWSNEGISLSLGLLKFWARKNGSWQEVSGSTTLFNFANGTFTAEYSDPAASNITATSFFLADQRRIVVGSNSTL